MQSPYGASALETPAHPTGARASWPAVAIPALLLLVLGWTQRWVTDDAFINFRVVDQLLAGNGPVFNAGERVEAYTSPLWLAILAAIHGILGFVSLEWLTVVLGLLLSVAGVAMATAAAALLAHPRRGLLIPAGALVFVALPPTWDYATSGLENGLVFAWLGGTYLALVAAHRGDVTRIGAIAVLAGLGPLIRPDLALFSVAFAALAVLVGTDRSAAPDRPDRRAGGGPARHLPGLPHGLLRRARAEHGDREGGLAVGLGPRLRLPLGHHRHLLAARAAGLPRGACRPPHPGGPAGRPAHGRAAGPDPGGGRPAPPPVRGEGRAGTSCTDGWRCSASSPCSCRSPRCGSTGVGALPGVVAAVVAVWSVVCAFALRVEYPQPFNISAGGVADERKIYAAIHARRAPGDARRLRGLHPCAVRAGPSGPRGAQRADARVVPAHQAPADADPCRPAEPGGRCRRHRRRWRGTPPDRRSP